MDSIDVKDTYTLNVNEESFVSVLVLSGEGSLNLDSQTLSCKAGDSVFIPANAGDVCLNGEFKVLISSL
jgi:mannose-6-phosphate isomerase